MPPPAPQCWKCGYELTGLRVDDLCPECGTPIWPPPVAVTPNGAPVTIHPEATKAAGWGAGALALFFFCLGPLAALVAIPALISGHRVLKMVRTGALNPSQAAGARAGVVCAYITLALSVGFVVLMVLAPD